MCWQCDRILEQSLKSEVRKVVYVADGDCFCIVPGFVYHEKEWCRLLGVDCAEKNEPGGPEAKEFLESLILRRWIHLEFAHRGHITRDRYGRLLVYAFVDNRLVNAELVKYGYSAWIKRWGRGPLAAMFQHALAWATDNRLGIWKAYETKYRTYFGRGREKIWFRNEEEFLKFIKSVSEEELKRDGKILADSGFFAWLNTGQYVQSQQRRRVCKGQRKSDQSQYGTPAKDQGHPVGPGNWLGFFNRRTANSVERLRGHSPAK